jgi:hypothetical protein
MSTRKSRTNVDDLLSCVNERVHCVDVASSLVERQRLALLAADSRRTLANVAEVRLTFVDVESDWRADQPRTSLDRNRPCLERVEQSSGVLAINLPLYLPEQIDKYRTARLRALEDVRFASRKNLSLRLAPHRRRRRRRQCSMNCASRSIELDRLVVDMAVVRYDASFLVSDQLTRLDENTTWPGQHAIEPFTWE